MRLAHLWLAAECAHRSAQRVLPVWMYAVEAARAGEAKPAIVVLVLMADGTAARLDACVRAWGLQSGVVVVVAAVVVVE